MNMILFGMKIRNFLVALGICLLFTSCNKSKDQGAKDIPEPILNLTFYYENGNDTVVYGEETDLAIKIEDNVFDSLKVVIGNVKDGKLLDTMGVIPVKNNAAFFVFKPNKEGRNVIQGVVREYKIDKDKTIVKTTPFETSYYCIKP